MKTSLNQVSLNEASLNEASLNTASLNEASMGTGRLGAMSAYGYGVNVRAAGRMCSSSLSAQLATTCDRAHG